MMGFFDKLLGGIGAGSSDGCPNCGASLDNEHLVSGSHWCESCGTLFRDIGGTLVDVKDLRDTTEPCEMCQSSLSGGVRYLPYEDGSNSHAYIKCPSCGHENVRNGFGEDDD